jgi:hypothetical protein
MSPSNQEFLAPSSLDNAVEQMSQLIVVGSAERLPCIHQRPQVVSLHQSLINSLVLYYEMLVKMQYLTVDAIYWLPHAELRLNPRYTNVR